LLVFWQVAVSYLAAPRLAPTADDIPFLNKVVALVSLVSYNLC
jgi:hypothetical protein